MTALNELLNWLTPGADIRLRLRIWIEGDKPDNLVLESDALDSYQIRALRTFVMACGERSGPEITSRGDL